MENKAVIRTLPSAKNDDRDELVKVFFCSIIFRSFTEGFEIIH